MFSHAYYQAGLLFVEMQFFQKLVSDKDRTNNERQKVRRGDFLLMRKCSNGC